mmetsp:Transcript_26789/g.42330  ORF Transcript_26789/g.42330 Transcript_26789/m.42330 type:complete len:473 (+) Transcript_26789:43-1461(+)
MCFYFATKWTSLFFHHHMLLCDLSLTVACLRIRLDRYQVNLVVVRQRGLLRLHVDRRSPPGGGASGGAGRAGAVGGQGEQVRPDDGQHLGHHHQHHGSRAGDGHAQRADHHGQGQRGVEGGHQHGEPADQPDLVDGQHDVLALAELLVHVAALEGEVDADAHQAHVVEAQRGLERARGPAGLKGHRSHVHHVHLVVHRNWGTDTSPYDQKGHSHHHESCQTLQHINKGNLDLSQAFVFKNLIDSVNLDEQRAEHGGERHVEEPGPRHALPGGDVPEQQQVAELHQGRRGHEDHEELGLRGLEHRVLAEGQGEHQHARGDDGPQRDHHHDPRGHPRGLGQPVALQGHRGGQRDAALAGGGSVPAKGDVPLDRRGVALGHLVQVVCLLAQGEGDQHRHRRLGEPAGPGHLVGAVQRERVRGRQVGAHGAHVPAPGRRDADVLELDVRAAVAVRVDDHVARDARKGVALDAVHDV